MSAYFSRQSAMGSLATFYELALGRRGLRSDPGYILFRDISDASTFIIIIVSLTFCEDYHWAASAIERCRSL